jgi:signal transduction histidine kinase
LTTIAVVVLVVWGVAGLVLVGAGHVRTGLQVLGGCVVGAVAVWGAHDATTAGAFAAALVPAAAGIVGLGLPDGRMTGTGRVAFAGALVIAGVAAGAVYASAGRVPSGLEVMAGAAVAVALVAPSVRRRSRHLAAPDRARMQLLAAGITATVAVAIAAGMLAVLADSDRARAAMLLAGALPALALVAGCVPAGRRVAPATVSVAVAALALTVALAIGQAVAVLALGRLPDDDEQAFLAPSLLAAAVATLAYAPARRSGAGFANRWVFGIRRRPESAGRTLTERASEGVPLDELLLQLCETLRWATGAQCVEVWTREGAVFDRATSVPDRGPASVACTTAELSALARTHVAGDAWLDLWVPRLRNDRSDAQVRLAPAVHTGAVLGYLLVERLAVDPRFGEDDDHALAEIGRRLAEVLHARRLDAALTSTLDDLRASRSRLVAAADAERRRIERNLHDGAQQHLVALAVSLRLARDLAQDDPEASAEILDQLGHDVRDTIQQLRDLAHGIYPPLLADAGLAEALRAAAQRSPNAVRVDSTRDRFPAEVEAAVYFCCLEALQNAAKHAPDADVEVRVWDDERVLRFEITDDGPGFDVRTATAGHGFQNMADRLGAIGGRVSWHGIPGRGTRVAGEVTT